MQQTIEASSNGGDPNFGGDDEAERARLASRRGPKRARQSSAIPYLNPIQKRPFEAGARHIQPWVERRLVQTPLPREA